MYTMDFRKSGAREEYTDQILPFKIHKDSWPLFTV